MRHPDHTVDPALVEHLSTLVADGQMDRYPLLGEGLSGKVYEFEHYAVKVFKADAGERQDASLLSLLSDHAAFPRVHYREEGWMMMDKVNGYTLGEVIQGGEKLKEHLYTQIEEAVEHCYAKGLIPDDLHLNNVMVDHEGRIKIVDVGRFFHTERAAAHKEALAEDLETLKYCGLFRFFSSSKRKKKRHWFSSDHRRRRSHSGSSPRRYSSSERRWRRRRSSW